CTGRTSARTASGACTCCSADRGGRARGSPRPRSSSLGARDVRHSAPCSREVRSQPRSEHHAGREGLRPRNARRGDRASRTAARARGIDWIEIVEHDLDEPALPSFEADALWSRWVFAFVKDPKGLLARAARALVPGGRMALYEYCDYRAWRPSPPSEVFAGFVSEVMASWRAGGGEPDIGLTLPGWLDELGFDVRDLVP